MKEGLRPRLKTGSLFSSERNNANKEKKVAAPSRRGPGRCVKGECRSLAVKTKINVFRQCCELCELPQAERRVTVSSSTRSTPDNRFAIALSRSPCFLRQVTMLLCVGLDRLVVVLGSGSLGYELDLTHRPNSESLSRMSQRSAEQGGRSGVAKSKLSSPVSATARAKKRKWLLHRGEALVDA